MMLKALEAVKKIQAAMKLAKFAQGEGRRVEERRKSGCASGEI